jgi:tRNA pseudouridine38-40 synthase
MSRPFLASLQFDGRTFVGWQRQAAGRSVQGEVEQVLLQIAGAPIRATAAGRTDAGVHAEGLGVSFELPDKWTAPDVQRALNALLPRDCWVASVHEMAPGFHARKSALSRRYRYVIGTDRAAASPFRRPFEWALCRPLDVAVLDIAADVVRGDHSFEAFSVRGQEKPHYRCRVSHAEWRPRGGRGFEFHIEADRFLHHMVRMLVGTMVDIGLGRRDVGDMVRLLGSRDNQDASPPAPPEGLFFVRATYPAVTYADSLAAVPSDALHDA